MNIETITLKELCSIFDHTLVLPNASTIDIAKHCEEAKENNFAMVAVNSAQVSQCKKYLINTNVHVGASISFPFGQTTIQVKAFETHNAVNEGADEIDYVMNISEAKDHNYAFIQNEMETIINICRNYNVISKVIFENCYLEDKEIVEIVKIANIVKPDFVKTSTGFGSSGASVKDIRLMKSVIGEGIKIKAAGGIRTWSVCREMIEAGAERIGTSKSLEIIRDYISNQNV